MVEFAESVAQTVLASSQNYTLEEQALALQGKTRTVWWN